MSKLRVGVLRGGPSSEYAVSLKTGQNVLANLPEDKYHGVDIFLSEDGEWHYRGKPVIPADLTQHVDVVFNALHGTYGEDGKVQRVLESVGIPYTGSGVLPSAIAMHKPTARDYFSRAGLKVARGTIITGDDNVPERIAGLPRNMEYVVKPTSGGSSVGAHIVEAWPGLFDAIADTIQYGDVLIEELIRGKEATCGVVDSGLGDDLFALHPVEIIPAADKDFFDYEAKYAGKSQEICPGRFTIAETGELRRQAALAHKTLGLRHYSRSDFIVSPHGIYILEVNTLPGLTLESLIPKALKASNVEFHEFLDHVIEMAMAR